ncbi:rolling circle replication-associated protein [Methanorbis furvi]
MEGKTLNIDGYDTFSCKPVTMELEYVHRFTESYLKGLLWKFSRLEEWYKEHKTPVYLLSLTTSSKNKTIREAFDVLREGWRNLAHVLRKMRQEKGMQIEYIYVYEPHKSGYPHIHVALFGNLTDDDVERLRRLWSDKYKIGSYEHGLNISLPRKHQEIHHVRAYILEYVKKSIDLSNVTVPHFVFLAVLWSFYDKSQWSWKIPYWTASGTFAPKSTGGGAFRLWGASRQLTQIMKFDAKEIDATQNGVQYARFGGQIPEVIVRLSKESLRNFLSENGL